MDLETKDARHPVWDINVEHGKADPFAAAVKWSRMPMIFVDPRKLDMPIIYANEAFCRLSGYEIKEVIGRNCRFLQGPETDRESVAAIARAIADRVPIGIDILNYRKDGSTFWNALYLSPVFNERGELAYFFASQFDATHRYDRAKEIESRKTELETEVGERTRDLEATLRSLEAALAEKTLLINEIEHRVKNNLQTISTLISMHARNMGAPASSVFRSLRERVDALGLVHRKLYNDGSVGNFDLAILVRDLVPEVVRAYAGDRVKVKLETQPVVLDSSYATPLSLVLNEIVTNAARHAWDFDKPGTLEVQLRQQPQFAVLTIADNGKGMPPIENSDRLSGLKLAEALTRQLRGTIRMLQPDQGTAIEITVPAATAAIQ